MPWALGVLVGTALQLQQAQLWPLAFYGFALVLALAAAWLAWSLRCHPIGFTVVAMACGCLLSFSQAGWRAQVFAGQAMPAELEGQDIEVVGRIQGLPQFMPEALRFGLTVELAHIDGRSVALPPDIALTWYRSRTAPPEPDALDEADATDGQIYRQALVEQARRQPQPVVPGERWRMTVRLKAPHGHMNPYGHDHELRLWEDGVGALGYVRTVARHPAPLRLDPPRGAWIDRARLATRSALLHKANGWPSAGVIAALVMGDQQAIERADWDLFRATGVAHLMSISGLHITLFAWLATAAVGALWRRSAAWSPVLCLAVPAHVAGACGGLLLATAYALYSGWAVPAQRTIFMLAVVVLLRLLARRWPWPAVWLLVMAAVLLMDPWALMQAGFWLSFVAVGFLFASEGRPQEQRSSRVLPWMGRALTVAATFLREQWVMTVALAPLSLLLFQQVSVVGLLANILAIPWVTLLVTPLGLLGTVLPPLWEVAAWLMHILTQCLTPLAHAPWAVVERPAAPGWCAAGGLLGGLLCVMRWPGPLRLLGLALMLPVFLWQPPRPAPGQFEVLALDVGQGSAVLVRTAHYSLLYDAGPRYSRESDAGHRVLVPLLRALGLKLDLLVLSHGDSDHIGGAAAVLARQPGLAVLSSLPQDPALRAGPNPHQACRAGQRWRRDGVDFEILHPSESFASSTRKSNALSCVLMISAAGGRALLTGDLEAAQERQLVLQQEQEGALQAQWLLAPHHGSRTSSSAEFLDAVRPQVVVVQAGYRNRFGHPAESVVQRYQQRQIRLVSTVGCGAALWRSERPGQIDCQRDRSPRYWHHRPPDASSR